MIKSNHTDHLSLRQKAQLALNISVIYFPLRLYVNIHDLEQVSWILRLPLWTMEFIVIFLFFYLWIIVIEWVQQQLFGWFGRNFLLDLKTPTQIATFLTACGLAVLFNVVFRIIWNTSEIALEKQFGIIQKQSIENTLSHFYTRDHKRKSNNGLTFMALLSAFYFTSNRRTYRQLQNIQIEAERLEKENIRAQFAALKNQISPHFLFNNFSILSSLIETNSDLSVTFVNRLSKAYRYILEQNEHEYISLKSELDFIETYVFLLLTRFDKKLKVNVSISTEEATQCYIAPLTLQLLIENTVKHNRMSERMPLVVDIFLENGYIVVKNPLQPRLQPEISTGVGLHNIVNRYKLLTQLPVMIEETEKFFVVRIPLIA